MLSLCNKTVMITGASSGIGEACARGFAAFGSRLIIAARRKDALDGIASELVRKHGVEVLALPLDVTDRKAVVSAFDSLDERWREIDILVNNAGLALGLEKFHESEEVDWDTVIDTNVKGAFLCAKLVLKRMVARNSGHLINVGSLAGHEVYPGGAIYCATKHAIRAFSKAVRLDLLGSAVRVSSVDPGLVETGFSAVRFRGDLDRARKVYEGVSPLTGEDVADAIIYCASRPAHVNICEVVMTPVDQASTTAVHRRKS